MGSARFIDPDQPIEYAFLHDQGFRFSIGQRKRGSHTWYLLTGFLLWLLGTPGIDGLSFNGSGQKGQIIYSSTLLALGFARSLTIGTGIIEMTSECGP